MKKIIITIAILFSFNGKMFSSFLLHNDYSYLQEITFELYTDEVPAYKVPEQIKSIEEILMFEVLHATWKDKQWVSFTLNKNLLGTYKVGQPALLDNEGTKKIFFVAAFPGSFGGLDLYTAEYSKGTWSKPKNLGKNINTSYNESNPGLLNDHTLTYSSGGIIKKLDLNTFKVVDLEEVLENDSKTTEVTKNIIPIKELQKKEEITAIDENSAANEIVKEPIQKTNELIVVPQKPKNEIQQQQKPSQVNTAQSLSSTQNMNVQSLGVQSRDAMLAKYKTAIQLGAFTTPKWEIIQPLSKYGQIISYKNDNGANVVWIVGFANHAAAEIVLPQIKSTVGFENAYITGK